MSIPAIIYLVLVAVALLISANQHGKDKTGKHSFWASLIATLLMLGLFYWGGFFN